LRSRLQGGFFFFGRLLLPKQTQFRITEYKSNLQAAVNRGEGASATLRGPVKFGLPVKVAVSYLDSSVDSTNCRKDGN
jgi:hypothetical protein